MRSQIGPARALSIVIAAFALVVGVTVGIRPTSAQEMTPHPAHIHSGSCAELGDVVYPLTDVASANMSASPMAEGMMGSPMSEEMMGTPTTAAMTDMASPTMDDMMATPMGSPMSGMAEMSVTTVQVALSDLTAGGYAINVHESAENIGNYIACGDITGMSAGTSDVTVELQTLNDSGYSGTAMLHDNGDGTTTVTIEIMHAGM